MSWIDDLEPYETPQWRKHFLAARRYPSVLARKKAQGLRERKRYAEDPEFRARKLALRKLRYATEPEFRAKEIAAVAAYRARAKAAKT